MLLGDIVERLNPNAVTGSLDRDIRAVVYDSRKATAASLFVALEGGVTDGRRFIGDAAGRGAVAVMGRSLAPRQPEGLTWVEVDDPRYSMGLAAACLEGNPSEDMHLAGITGTNGKTTTAFLLRAIWEGAAFPAGLIGTIEYSTGKRTVRAVRTTPESPDIQALLGEMLAAGVDRAVMEVSSHGLELGRIAGCSLALAIFTRVTRDHLDYHGSSEAYLAAKANIVDYVRPGGAVVLNRDDEFAYGFVSARAKDREIISYGSGETADLRGTAIDVTLDGLAMDVLWKGEHFPVRSPLIGAFNAENILAAVGGAIATGVPPDVAVRGAETLKGVPGRFERVDGGAPFGVIVDYAHTDDALEKLLGAVRALAGGGRIICVFGCGGNRDRTKRAPMGRAADRWCTIPIVTTDNPRGEDPETIFADILGGMGSGKALVIDDRREAIYRAVTLAEPDDVVVIAGKGHETEQEVGGESFHFSDAEVAREALAVRFGGGAGNR